MKKLLTTSLLATFATLGQAAPVLGQAARQDEDLAAVMRVVKKSNTSDSHLTTSLRTQKRPARYLKVSLFDKRDKESLKLSLPIQLVQWLAEMGDSENLRDLGAEIDLDLKAIFQVIKEIGPAHLLEIDSDEGKIRVWLE